MIGSHLFLSFFIGKRYIICYDIFNTQKGGSIMKKTSLANTFIIGITLFSMFFGAGNLIFPPLLGAQSGKEFLPAILGFIATAVIIPTIAIVAVAKHQGLKNLTDRIHPLFTTIFVTLVYLLIGPCVAIPRTASTSFEMAIAPLMTNSFLSQIFYALIFFALSSYVALHPNRLKDLLGKIMAPILLILIAVLFIGTLIAVPSGISEPNAHYSTQTFLSGFIDGYQTMDILAALNFGIIIALNIQDLGIKNPKQIAKEIMKAGVIAGLLLGIVYLATGYIGMHTSLAMHEVGNGAEVLSYAIYKTFGSWGQWIVGIIFFIACFNVSTGLLSCCAEYFYELVPKFSYKTWLFGFATFSFIVSSFGLNFILEFSVPILSIMCPIAILIVFIGLILPYKEK